MTYWSRVRVAIMSLLLVAAFVPLGHAADLAAESTWEWTGIERVVAVGDVSGALGPLTALLEGVGLVDGELLWSGGQTHLVFIGDLIDRGDEDREVMDLARRLQTEAAAAGGRVHVLLGNHEAMNIMRDLRYVSEASFAAFAEDERPEDRQHSWKRHRYQKTSAGIGQRAFDDRYPPGYFGRVRALGAEGEYGAWLLEQPTVIKINDFIFVHGGLTDEVASLGLDGINRGVRKGLEEYLRHAAVLDESVGGLPDYQELQQLAADRAPASSKVNASPVAAAARGLLELENGLHFAPGGPLWYRGNSLENERIERGPVKGALRALGAKAMVVGHTPTRPGVITSRFRDRLYRIDVGSAYRGRAMALVLEGGEVRVFDSQTLAYAGPLRETDMGEGWPATYAELPRNVLERFLKRAKIEKVEEILRLGRRFQVVQLRGQGLHLRAVFGSVDERGAPGEDSAASTPRSYRHELAAYRLDRMLGRDFVPVTVERRVKKEDGALQLFLETAVDLTYIEEHGRFDLLVGLEPEVREAMIFSALVGSRDRIDAAKMLLPSQRQIMLADSTRGFPLDTEVEDLLTRRREEYDPGPCRPMDPDLEASLRAMTRKESMAELGEYLSEAQIDALLGRRDRILALCGSREEGAARSAAPAGG
jgi:hypothetical protein